MKNAMVMKHKPIENGVENIKKVLIVKNQKYFPKMIYKKYYKNIIMEEKIEFILINTRYVLNEI